MTEAKVGTWAGAAGGRERLSRLELTFARRDSHTHLAEQFATGPLKVLRPFALGDGRVPLQLLNVGPGLLAGDRYELEVGLEPGAKIVLVNQSATKLHRMPPGEGARRHLATQAEAGAELELYPGLVIPFAESDALFETTVRLSRGARFAVLELDAMGRAQRREPFSFRRLANRFRIFSQEQLVYADGLELTPEAARHTGVTDGFSYLAAGFWQWDALWPEPKLSLESPSVQAVTGLCGPAREYLRTLARDGLELTESVKAQLKAWHLERGVTSLPFEQLLLYGRRRTFTGNNPSLVG